MEKNIHYRTCNLCEAMCGVEIHTEGKEITQIRGDKNDEFSRGHVCPKAVALQDLHNDPDRLKRPIKKVGDTWQEIEWEEAFDYVAERLVEVQKKHGNNGVAVYLGNPNVHNMGSMLFGSFLLRALKTRNKYSATSVDQLPHMLLATKMFGHQLMMPVPDIDNSDYLMVLGGNPIASNGSIMSAPDIKKRLKGIVSRGKVVVIDPRKTETAAIASEHHFIKPGSDALFLLALINTLYTEGLVAKENIADYIDGLEVMPGLVGAYTPERVADQVGINAEAIKVIAREFAAAKRGAIYGRIGVSVQAFGGLCQWLILVANMLTGRLDAEGGMMFTKPAADVLALTASMGDKGHFNRYQSRVRGLPAFSGEYPASAMIEEMATPGDGQIKAMLTIAGNPVLSTPNGAVFEKALADLDFMVSIDFYINETSKHADIILPPVSHLEREHYDIIFHTLAIRNTAKYSPALFEPEIGAKHDWEIYSGLQRSLEKARGQHGVKEKAATALRDKLAPKGMLAMMLRSGPYGSKYNIFKKGLTLKELIGKPHGVDLGALQPCLPERLFTNDKRINVADEIYVTDMARVEEHFFKNGTNEEFPLLLIGRRHVRSNNSWLHNSYRLVKGKARCTAMIHPLDAKDLDIEEGQEIVVTSRVGSIEITAEVTEDIMRGVISVPHGWGHHRKDIRLDVAEAHAGVSVNDITDDQFVDALSGNAAVNGVPVSVVKVVANGEEEVFTLESVVRA